MFSVPIAVVHAGQDGTTAERHADRGLEFAKAGDLPAAESELRAAVARAPNNATYLGDLGTILAMEEKFAESAEYLSEAVKLDPGALVVRQNLAADLWRLRRFAEAKENLRIILRAQPHDEQAILLLGMVSENSKDYAAAARLLGCVPALVRERPESVAALARSWYHLGQREKARETLEGLLHNPTGPEGIFLGGRVAAEAGDDGTAERLFMAIPVTYPHRSRVDYSLAVVRYHAGHYAEAQRGLQDLIHEGHETGEVDNLLGWCYEKQGKSKEAVSALESAIDRDPKQESQYLDLGHILLTHKLYPAALTVAKRGVVNLPDFAAILDLKGSAELKMSQYTDAIRSYSHVRQLQPTDSEAALGFALAEEGAGMTQQAARAFEQGIREFPRNARYDLEYALMLLGLARAGDRVAGVRGERLLKQAIQLDGSLAEAHYQLGNIALEGDDTAEAVRQLGIAVRIEPDSSKVHFALARAYRRLGEQDAARREMALFQSLKHQEEQSAQFASPAGMARE
ncbi:MAG: tetratricopeptide repeat protein [Terriglobia bacterium]